MSFRKIVFWLHLCAGVAAGSVILVLSVTGVLLAFERQILEWSARGQKVEVTSDPLPLDELLDQAHAVHPNPTGLTLRTDPTAPVEVNYGRETTRLVNPYTGDALETSDRKLHAFFDTVTGVHRWFALSGKQRAWGKNVTGACNAVFVGLAVSGLYLWFPRRWNWRNFRAVLWFQRRLRGKARDFNWHNAIGLWCAPFLILIAGTGMLISYSWTTGLLYRAVGEKPPPPRERSRTNEAGQWDELDRLVGLAKGQAPGWQTLAVTLAPAGKPVPFTIAASHRGRPDLRTQLSLAPDTGEVIKREVLAGQSRGRQLRTWARWIHTGEAGGWIGQLAAAVASAGAVVLVWTGFALTWRRFRNRQKA